MNVVHVVAADLPGGAERMLVDLAGEPSERARRAHAVALVTPSERLRALLREAGLDVEDRGAAREGPLTYLVRSLGSADVAWLEGIIRRRRAGLVHLHTFGSQVVGTRAALRAGARVLRTEHSTRVYEDMSCWPFSRWSLQRADLAVCISEHVKRVAVARAPWASPVMRVVPNGVDVERFDERPMTPRGSQEPVRLLALGRLEPRKGIDVALRAVARVPDVELDVVGDGPSRRDLEALSSSLGIADRVRFRGYAEDVRGAIERSHLVVSSARSEGLGIALLEAMSMGRAVVASPTGGVPEIVRDGETGWLAADASEAALAQRLRDAIATPSEIVRRGSRARARVVDAFSVASMRAGYEGLYASLTER